MKHKMHVNKPIFHKKKKKMQKSPIFTFRHQNETPLYTKENRIKWYENE